MPRLSAAFEVQLFLTGVAGIVKNGNVCVFSAERIEDVGEVRGAVGQEPPQAPFRQRARMFSMVRIVHQFGQGCAFCVGAGEKRCFAYGRIFEKMTFYGYSRLERRGVICEARAGDISERLSGSVLVSKYHLLAPEMIWSVIGIVVCFGFEVSPASCLDANDTSSLGQEHFSLRIDVKKLFVGQSGY